MQDDGGRFPIIIIIISATDALLFPVPPKVNVVVTGFVAPEGK